MLENMLSKEELEALMRSDDSEFEAETKDARLESGEKDKLLHAVVRNQLRLLRMIDELQSEVNSLRSEIMSLTKGGAALQIAAATAAEPVPLPFMYRRQEEPKDSGPPPAYFSSRKDKFKKNLLW